MKHTRLGLLVLFVSSLQNSCGGDGGRHTQATAFSVAGTVVGLGADKSLVLQNNGGDDLTITHDGTFSFQTKIKDGEGYAVTIATQPDGQTCTVSNATGTIARADVSDVSVSCSVGAYTYTVGGMVSGLGANKTLVLQNNGGDDLTLTHDGPFTFATALQDGATYVVTMSAEPQGQTCVVSNATDVVSGAEVTSVSVVCSSNPYAIGGTVSGLGAGTTVVLQNNDGDNLVLSAQDTSFVFVTPVVDGAPYAVTVATQPEGQICTVAQGSGTVAAAPVTNVLVECAVPWFGARYGVAPNWNDYVDAVATTSVCDAYNDSAVCLHGGESKALELRGKTDCAGLSAEDALGAFAWTCDASTNPVRMVSTGLKDGVYLSDLLDFDALAFKANSVTAYSDEAEYVTTEPSVWWQNPIVVDNNGGTLNSEGTIYVVTANTVGDDYGLSASKVALVGEPGVVLTSIDGSGRVFLWVEGTVAAGGDPNGVGFSGVRFSVMRNVVVSGASSNAISLSSSAFNNKLTDVTASNNDGAGVFVGYTASGNVLSRVTASNNNTGVILNQADNNTLMDVTASMSADRGMYMINAHENTLLRVTVSDNASPSGGFDIQNANHNVFEDIEVSNNTTDGIRASSMTGNLFEGVKASGNGSYGISLSNNVTSNTFSQVTASNNAGSGFYSRGVNNTLTEMVAANNGGQGIVLNDATNHTLVGITALSNQGAGVALMNAVGTAVFGVSAANNGGSGVHVTGDSGSSNLLSNIAAVSNTTHGVSVSAVSHTRLDNVMAVSNAFNGVYLYFSSNNTFTGVLKVGSNASGNCLVYAYDGSNPTAVNPGLDDDLNPGDVSTSTDIHSGLCVPQGSSSFGAAITGVSVTSSFAGKVTVDDGANQSDAGGSATYNSLEDWTHFDNGYRGWGKDGGAFPFDSNRGRCTSGTCRIWDFTLLATGSVLRAVNALPTGNDTLIRTWAEVAASQAECDTFHLGSLFATDHCETTVLRHAIEILGDGIGNDNRLCESNEACLFMPNIASYQGHGDLISAGAFTDGTITGVTLMTYTDNGL